MKQQPAKPQRRLPDLARIEVEAVNDPVALRREIEDTLFAASMFSRHLTRMAVVLGNHGYNEASRRTCLLQARACELRWRAVRILDHLP